MTSTEIAANIATLVVLILVMGLITVPKKSDTPAVKTMRKIGRHTFTATLLLCVIMGAFALYAAKH
jgi:hypothetical protein